MNVADREAADALARAVRRRTGIRKNQLVCPYEQSDMTPCVHRDGCLALAYSVRGPVCVGCDRNLSLLVASEARRAIRDTGHGREEYKDDHII